MHDFRTLSKRLLPFRVKRLLRSGAFRTLDLSWQLPSNVHVCIKSQSDWCVYNEVFAEGAYDPAIVMALERAEPAGRMQVLDLGANVGFFVLRCIDLARRQRLQALQLHVTAIEGNPRVCGELKRRLCRDNKLSNVTIINGLVGERTGTASISDLEFSGQNRVRNAQSRRNFAVQYLDVEKAMGTGRISLLKCDIEGAELDFLRSYPGLLRRTDIAVFELHSDECDENECASLLRDAGFSNERPLGEKSATKLVLFWR